MDHFSRRSALSVLSALAAIAPLGVLRAAGDAPGQAGRRVALSGYDPVAYFTGGRPEKGSDQFQAEYDDATYWFTSSVHQALFVADPDRYAPQFAGFCAVTVARGEKAEADPQAWLISDGKLYVFRGPQGVDRFRQQGTGIVSSANTAWPGLSQRP